MNERVEDSRPLSSWARFARQLFKGLLGLWATVYFVSALVWVGSEVLGYRVPDPLGDTHVIYGVFVSFAALAGLLWLVGEGLAGFNSRD